MAQFTLPYEGGTSTCAGQVRHAWVKASYGAGYQDADGIAVATGCQSERVQKRRLWSSTRRRAGSAAYIESCGRQSQFT